MKELPILTRLERNYIPEPNSGCWLWTSCVDMGGYGYLHNRTRAGAKNMKAHRVSYEEFIGPIPEGMYVCHSCDTPSCINPRHLWLGTHAQNQQDRIRKGRSAKGEDFKRKLTESDIREIRASKESLTKTATKYGVVFQTISEIRNRKIWAHVQ